jgi:hypothetical protein
MRAKNLDYSDPIEGAEVHIATGSTILNACKLMAKDDRNIKTQRFACQALANLACCSDIRNYMAVCHNFEHRNY